MDRNDSLFASDPMEPPQGPNLRPEKDRTKELYHTV